jgi:hypothetical protein
MKFSKYINEGFIDTLIKKIIKEPASTALNDIKSGFMDFIDMISKADINTQKKILSALNKSLGTNYNSIDNLKKVTKLKLGESDELNEDWKHFWNTISTEGFFNIKFFPALQVWFEIANLLGNALKGEPFDMVTVKKAAFYFVLWLALASGKFIKDFFKWKKEKPEEYERERGKISNRELAKFI